MARGPVQPGALGSRQEQQAARAAGVARVKELLAHQPMTGPQLASVLLEELKVVQSTVLGYLRHMQKSERSIRPAGGMRGRAELWTLGADPALPDPDEVLDRMFAAKRATVPACQVGMWRDPLVAAMFGPAQGSAA